MRQAPVSQAAAYSRQFAHGLSSQTKSASAVSSVRSGPAWRNMPASEKATSCASSGGRPRQEAAIAARILSSPLCQFAARRSMVRATARPRSRRARANVRAAAPGWRTSTRCARSLTRSSSARQSARSRGSKASSPCQWKAQSSARIALAPERRGEPASLALRGGPVHRARRSEIPRDPRRGPERGATPGRAQGRAQPPGVAALQSSSMPLPGSSVPPGCTAAFVSSQSSAACGQDADAGRP